jgi:GAF domain-containing protein
MSESIVLNKEAGKASIYEELIPQIQHLVQGESDPIANLANIGAALNEAFGFFWVGFYRVCGDELVLGPFQGSIACTRIKKGRGVCGKAWETGKSILVPDVDLFPGHIACSSLSRSEIVLPILVDGKTIGVLDIDSDRIDDFDETDRLYLERLLMLLEDVFKKYGQM